MSGLLHISQISFDRIEDLPSILEIDMPLKCMIIDHDKVLVACWSAFSPSWRIEIIRCVEGMWAKQACDLMECVCMCVYWFVTL